MGFESEYGMPWLLQLSCWESALPRSQNSPEKIELRKVVEISVLQLLKGIEGRLLIERYAVEATLLIEGTPLGFNPKEGCLGVKLDLLVS
jgi:hypothetical protein